ncbi:GH3 auxin-responsive promoter family protein [Mycoplasmatota bacterium zrk1]
MKFEQQLATRSKREIWDSFCGFLEYSMDEYMQVQTRLMEEQIDYWSKSEIGQTILKGQFPKSIDEFRNMVPLTTYEDYADSLLPKQSSSLPMHPVVWIETTWEGGRHPVKVAPYSRSMLDTYRKNMIGCLILSSSKQKGEFDVTVDDKLLYGLAPLPYATGLFPLLLKEEIDMKFLPDPIEAQNMSFSERNKEGFKMAMHSDVEFFFGLGSVLYAVTKNIMEASTKSGGVSSILKYPLKRIIQIAKAKKVSRAENRSMLPKDLFNLKGFMVAGTDNHFYKDDLEKMWGIRPMEIFAGTEPALIGTETWTRDGMYFFPDSCFYEFIKEDDYLHLLDNPKYVPNTYLMNEVVTGEKYEIVVTVMKGGAFARYRVGDVYECVGLKNNEDGTRIPRFRYVDRVLNIVDIAGFTRITEYSINKAIEHSKVKVIDWIARKEVSDTNRPFLKLYVEIDQLYLTNNPMSTDILKELLTTYFKFIDQDYKDLKKILGMEPLDIELLPVDTFKKYHASYAKPIRKLNASHHDVLSLLNFSR